METVPTASFVVCVPISKMIDWSYPRFTEGGKGVYWIHPDVCPSVCPSVRPSVDKVSGTFKKKTNGSIPFIPGIFPYWVSPLILIHFRVPSLIFGPLAAKYLAENGVSEIFWKKTSGSIHFIPGINPYGVSLLIPIHFCVPSLIFDPLVAEYLAENVVSGTFWSKLLAQCMFFLKNSHLCSTRLQNINLYWIFLDEMGNDQSGGMSSPFTIYGHSLLYFPSSGSYHYYLPKFSILASMFVWRFVTCENFQFWQVCSFDGLSVCLWVCNVDDTGRTVRAINTKLGTYMYLGSGHMCIVFGVDDITDDVIRSTNRSNFEIAIALSIF